MLELPEVLTLSKQADDILSGKTITQVFNATKPHKFTFYNGDPLEYGKLLVGKTIRSSAGYGMFEKLFVEAKKSLSAKALLATEQRIPGVGNGVTQDILFNASIHPKQKVSILPDGKKKKLFVSLKETLQQMTNLGGRDTQLDLYGNRGGYRTILSAQTWKEPCLCCGGAIVKEAYLGGSVYYCPNCQPIF